MAEGRNVLNPEYAKQVADKLASNVPADFDHVKDWLNSTFRRWFIENAPARRVVLADHFNHVLEIGDIVYGARVRQSERDISMRVCLVEWSQSPEWLQKAFQSYTPVYALSALATLPCEVLSNLESQYAHSEQAVIAKIQEDQKKALYDQLKVAEAETTYKTAVKRVRRVRPTRVVDEDIDDEEEPDDCEVAIAIEDVPINIELPPDPEPYDKAKAGSLDWCHWKMDTFTHFVDYLLTLPKKQLTLTIPHLLDQVHAWDKRLHNQKLIAESEKDTETIECKFLSEYDGGRLYLVKLVTPAAYIREGKLMSNCIASYANRTCELWSLREKDNPRPRGTIELRKESGARTIMRRAMLLDTKEVITVPYKTSGNGYSLYQAKGFANKAISVAQEVMDGIYAEFQIDISKSMDHENTAAEETCAEKEADPCGTYDEDEDWATVLRRGADDPRNTPRYR